MNFSTWPPVSTRRCSPVKNGWHFEQMSRRSSFWVEWRSEEHTSELQSQSNLVCRLLLEKKTQKLDRNRTRLHFSLSQRSPAFFSLSHHSHSSFIHTACADKLDCTPVAIDSTDIQHHVR